MAGTAQGYPNTWFFTLCFDTKSSLSEAMLLTLINQLRADPWAVVISNLLSNNLSGTIDPVTARALRRKMPPVFLDRALLETARIAAQAEAAGKILSENGQNQGYEGVFLEEICGTVPLEDDSQEKTVNRIFGKILEYKLDNLKDIPGILDYHAGDIGLAAMVSEVSNDFESMVFNVNAGIPKVTDGEEDTKRVYGILYVDRDKNGLYSPGEEVHSRDISVWEEDADENAVLVQTITTDYAGRFILFLPSEKRYRFSCAPQNPGAKAESFGLYRYLYRDVFLSFTLPLSEE